MEIGTGTISVDDLPAPYAAPQWVNVRINGGLSLAMAPGSQYAIVLSSANGAVRWHASTDVYSGGYVAANYGRGWSSVSNADAMFQTYVIPDTLDQSLYYPWWSYFYPLSLTTFANTTAEQGAQTFTAGRNGVVDRVRLYTRRGPSFNGDVEVSIQTTENGYPSGVEIGRGSIPWDTLPSTYSEPAWIEAAITPSGYVTAGEQYAIVVTGSCCGQFLWEYTYGDRANYARGQMLYSGGNGWTAALPLSGGTYFGDAGFQTFVTTPVVSPMSLPPDRTITPCSFGVCPEVAGKVTPADSTARVSSNVQFQELRDGTVHGILNFNDSRTGNFVLHGCTTTSAACRLKVTRFACTDQHAIAVEGTFTPKGEAARFYRLNLSGVKDDIGTFTLSSGGYKYTLSRYGIVHVTCPAVPE